MSLEHIIKKIRKINVEDFEFLDKVVENSFIKFLIKVIVEDSQLKIEVSFLQ